jgi:hypothetical protein
MFICLAPVLGCSDAKTHDWTPLADSDTGVVLLLGPETQTVKGDQWPRFTATLVNRGKNDVTLVEPGDGSNCGWQTPVVEWSRQAREKEMRCGNVNGLKADEAFTLRPGDVRVLSNWIGQPYLSGPGRYRVSLSYTNEPNREWLGIPLRAHDAKAMERVRRSTPVSTVSNPVEILVER